MNYYFFIIYAKKNNTETTYILEVNKSEKIDDSFKKNNNTVIIEKQDLGELAKHLIALSNDKKDGEKFGFFAEYEITPQESTHRKLFIPEIMQFESIIYNALKNQEQNK